MEALQQIDRNNNLFPLQEKPLSPSAEIILSILRIEGKMYVGEIHSKSRYSIRTVRYALRHLQDAGLIVKIKDLTDMRRHFYAVEG